MKRQETWQPAGCQSIIGGGKAAGMEAREAHFESLYCTTQSLILSDS